VIDSLIGAPRRVAVLERSVLILGS
jgi:hypothetical protein